MRRIFYGWWIMAAGLAVLFVSSGIGFYGHGVFLDPLREQNGWSKGGISFALTPYFLTAGVMGIFVGRLVDRHGPKQVLMAGSVLFGLGFAPLSHATAFGPTLAGVIFDTTQSYRIAFTIFADASLIAMGAIFLAKPPRQGGARSHRAPLGAAPEGQTLIAPIEKL